jgi:TATA-box binding protein (TBP) (component of TFIID and TFIIIB)
MINTNYKYNVRFDLNKICEIIQNNTQINISYNPELYRGLKVSYYYNDNNNKKDGCCYCPKLCKGKGRGNELSKCKKVTIVIFKSGSIMITGGCAINQTYQAFDFINDFIDKYYKNIVKISIADYIPIEEQTFPSLKKRKSKKIVEN